MPDPKLQTAFFKHLKEQAPANISLADEMADLLNISIDSAYRRLRCEKTLDFDEIQILSSHFKISLDQFLNLQTKYFLFSGDFISHEKFEMNKYVESIVRQLTHFADAEHKEIYFFNKDIPIFHHFMFPELAAFKCYFWSRYNLNYPNFNKGQFLISDFIDLFETTGKKISALYQEIPSTEIWNLDCVNTTIMQIAYYRDSKVFKSEDDINTVFNCLHKLVDHIEQQVERGYKFDYKFPHISTKASYKVFINDFILGDNMVLIKRDKERYVSIAHNVINYALTTDDKFIDYSWQTMEILLKKSTLISEIGERERQHFFNTIRSRIDDKHKRT